MNEESDPTLPGNARYEVMDIEMNGVMNEHGW